MIHRPIALKRVDLIVRVKGVFEFKLDGDRKGVFWDFADVGSNLSCGMDFIYLPTWISYY
jgi:hypothetical protein